MRTPNLPRVVKLTRRELMIGSAVSGLLQTVPWEAAHATPSGSASNHSPPLIRLALNESPFGPSPRVVQAIRNQLPTLARYTGVETERLIERIAAYENIAREHILLGEVLEPLGLHSRKLTGSQRYPSVTRLRQPRWSAHSKPEASARRAV